MWGLYIFFFQAEDGIRDAQESRGLGDVYKRQLQGWLDQRIRTLSVRYSSLEETLDVWLSVELSMTSACLVPLHCI